MPKRSHPAAKKSRSPMRWQYRVFALVMVAAVCVMYWRIARLAPHRTPDTPLTVSMHANLSSPSPIEEVVPAPLPDIEERLFTTDIYTESDSTCQFSRVKKAIDAPVRWAKCPTVKFTALEGHGNNVLRVVCDGEVKVAYVDHDFLFLEDRDSQGSVVQEPRRKERWDYVTYHGPVARLNFTGREYAEVLCVRDKKQERNLVTRFLPRPKNLAQRKNTLAKRGKTVVRNHLNLLVIVCDSLSRAHAMRELPQLSSLARSLYRDEGGGSSIPYRAFVFNRLNSLGTSSAANQSPLYSGTFWTPDKRRHGESVYPRQPSQMWLWEIAQKLGFITCYSEDWANGLMGYEWHNTTGWDHRAPGLQALSLPGNKRIAKGMWLPFCRDHGELSSAMYTRYVRSFWDAYTPDKDAAVMAQLHLMEQHHDPLGSVRQVDTTTTALVRHVLGTQENTAVVVVGDHGRRFVGEANGIDSTNPVFMIFLPKRVLERERTWAKNLFINQQRFLSHYDVHSMLSHILHYPNPSPKGIPHVLSLNPLTTVVPRNRTCAQANMKECFCSKWKRIANDKKHALTCINSINTEIVAQTRSSCKTLTLAKVDIAMVSGEGATMVDFSVHEGNRSRFHCKIDPNGKPQTPVTQITLWERFRPCRDPRIDPNHCICDPREKYYT